MPADAERRHGRGCDGAARVTGHPGEDAPVAARSAGLESYFATEESAREAELAAARPAFEHAEYADRLGRLRLAMSEAGIDVILLSHPESMCWLHGYTAR